MRPILPPETAGTFFSHPASPTTVAVTRPTGPTAIISLGNTATHQPVVALPQPAIPSPAQVAATLASQQNTAAQQANAPLSSPTTPIVSYSSPSYSTVPGGQTGVDGSFPWWIIIIVIVGAILFSRS